VTYFGQLNFVPTATATEFNVNAFGGAMFLMPANFTASNITFYGFSAASTAKLTPAIYSVSGSTLTLVATGPQVTGVTVGINTVPLTSPVTLNAGTIYLFGFIVLTAPLYTAAGPTVPVGYFSNSGATAPSSATASTTTETWTFWLS